MPRPGRCLAAQVKPTASSRGPSIATLAGSSLLRLLAGRPTLPMFRGTGGQEDGRARRHARAVLRDGAAARVGKRPSVEEYILVASTERRVDHDRRLKCDRWVLTVVTGTLPLPTLGLEVPLDDLHRDSERIAELTAQVGSST